MSDETRERTSTREGQIAAALCGEAVDLENLSPQDVRALVRALQARQKELERQNATLRQRADVAGAKDSERLDRILATLDTGLSLINPDMTIAWVNAKIHEMFPRADPVGRVCYTFYESAQGPCDDCGTRQAFASAQPYETERFNPADGRWYHIISLPIQDENGEVVNVLEGITDVTVRVQAEEALRESEARFRTIVNELPQFIAYTDKDLKYRFVNKTYQEKFNLEPDDVLGKTLVEVIGEEAFQKARPHVEKALRGERVRYHERYDYTLGETQDIDGILVPDVQDGQVRGYYAVLTDITPYIEAQEALRESEEKYRRLVENLQEGIWALDAGAYTTYVNPRMAEMLGYAREEMQGRHLFDFMDERGVQIARRNLDRREQGIKEQHDFEFLRQDGSRVYTSLETVPLFDEDGGYAGAIAAVADITERKQMEDRIRAALREKEAMLAEIHHRVKNNLQIISSLLDFQADHARDERVTSALRDSQHRVHSMALIHDELYHASDLAQINLENYVRNLATELFAAYRVDPSRRATLRLDVQDVSLDVQQAIPCGLILNELISNALKHAFPADLSLPDGEHPEIRVTFRADDAGRCVLAVRDNGIGLPPDFEFPDEDTLGLFLIQIFARQIDGQIEWRSEANAGTMCRVTFAA